VRVREIKRRHALARRARRLVARFVELEVDARWSAHLAQALRRRVGTTLLSVLAPAVADFAKTLRGFGSNASYAGEPIAGRSFQVFEDTWPRKFGELAAPVHNSAHPDT
jgi:hypothetical protein